MTKYNDRGMFGLTRAVDYTSASAGPTTAFASQTRLVRLATTSPAHFRIYDASVTSVCTSADPILPANVVEVVCVTPGQNVTFIKAAASVGSSDGRATVSELA